MTVDKRTSTIPVQEDDEARAHYLWRIAISYDVPIDLIRYEQSNNTERTDLYGLGNNDIE